MKLLRCCDVSPYATQIRRVFHAPLRVLFLLVLLLSLPVSGYASPHAQVLVINSYHHGFKWTDDIVAGIRSVLKDDAELRIEYMDTRRIFSREYLDKLYESYRLKFKGLRYDAIIVSDDPALDLMLEHREDLFPEVPVIFCGINDFTDARLGGKPLYTGVVEETDPRRTLEIARRFQPKVLKVIAPVNSNATGMANRRLLEKNMAVFKGVLEIEFVQDPELATFLKRLASLPKDEYMILLTGRFADGKGREIPVNESTPLLAASGIPTYSLWEFYLGHGIVGGSLTNGFYQGKTAAGMARRILAGEKDVAIVRTSPNEYMFDFRELKRNHIDLGLVPANSRVINRPESFLDRHSTAIWVGLSLTLSYSLIVLFLWRNIRQKNRAERELVIHKENLEHQVEERTSELQGLLQEQHAILDTLPTGLCILRKRVVERCNPALESMFGFPAGTLVGRSVRCLFENDELFEEYGRRIYSQMGQQGRFEGEVAYVRQNGERFWALDHGKSLFPERSVDYAIFSITDISEQKQQQEILNRRNRELEETLSRVRTLEGIISICMYCKKIRNEEHAWDQLEHYISEHTDALFSHGICPECHERLSADLKMT